MQLGDGCGAQACAACPGRGDFCRGEGGKARAGGGYAGADMVKHGGDRAIVKPGLRRHDAVIGLSADGNRPHQAFDYGKGKIAPTGLVSRLRPEVGGERRIGSRNPGPGSRVAGGAALVDRRAVGAGLIAGTGRGRAERQSCEQQRGGHYPCASHHRGAHRLGWSSATPTIAATEQL